MRLHEARHDLYRRLAKEQGYKSRAAFKLLQANEKYEFIHQGSKVLDLGSAPGGWLQVSWEFAGPTGKVVGVDLSEVKLRGMKEVVSLVGSVDDPSIPGKALAALGGKADVVLSDLAPQVSGVWELDQTKQADLTLRSVEICKDVLKPGGGLFCKVFEGPGSQEVRAALRKSFANVRVLKPAASRQASSELYYFCDGFLGA